MPSEARQKKMMEKLNRAQKCSILGPQNLGSGGGPGPRGPPLDPHLNQLIMLPTASNGITFVVSGHTISCEKSTNITPILEPIPKITMYLDRFVS